eukprot:420576_1
MTTLQNELAVTMKGINDDDVRAISIVTASWNAMLENVSDPSANQYKNNLEILKKITYFEFGDEMEQNVFARDDTTNYLRVIVGDDAAIEEKKQAQLQTLSENKFSSLLDAISIFITGSDGIPSDIPQKSLSEYTPNNLVTLINSKKLQGLRSPSKVINKIKTENITGSVIIQNVDIDSVRDLVFSTELQDCMDAEIVRKMASEITRTIQFMLLQYRIENEYMPKFHKCKQLATIRLNYYFEGGREQLHDQKRISINKTMKELDVVEKEWKDRLENWKKQILTLRQTYKVLTCFTVNDMRYLIEQIAFYIKYTVKNEVKRHDTLIKLTAKLSFIDFTISNQDVAAAFETHCKTIPTNIEELGPLLETMFSERLYGYKHIQMGIESMVLLSKRPHLFYIQDKSRILHKLIKLFLSKGQRPTANRILFCDKTTTIEQVECMFMRCALEGYSSEYAPLFTVIQPELLQISVQDHFLNVLLKYVNKSLSIFTIMTSSKESKIYQKLSAFECWNLEVFSDTQKKQFFEEILCKDDIEFSEKHCVKPMCKLFMSRNECV